MRLFDRLKNEKQFRVCFTVLIILAVALLTAGSIFVIRFIKSSKAISQREAIVSLCADKFPSGVGDHSSGYENSSGLLNYVMGNFGDSIDTVVRLDFSDRSNVIRKTLSKDEFLNCIRSRQLLAEDDIEYNYEDDREFANIVYIVYDSDNNKVFRLGVGYCSYPPCYTASIYFIVNGGKTFWYV